jgi:phage tail sheath protein FI
VGWTGIVPLTGGDSGTAPTNSDIELAVTNQFTERDNVDVDLLINGGYTNTAIQQAMETVARTRGTTVALLDVPTLSQGSPQDMIDWRNLTLNMNSSYAAAFGPDVLESDPYNGKSLYVPFSGWAAALCARTDRVAQPWFAIAGLNRGVINVLGIRKKTNGQFYGDAERTALFKAQINYTRSFTGQGIALWEQSKRPRYHG